MPVNIAQIVTGALKPISELVDSLHTSKEEKAAAQLAIVNAQGALQNELIGYQKDIIIAEATGESWLQRNWRPILMLSVVAIVVNNYLLYPYLSLFFDAAPLLDLPEKLWSLMQIGVGGYVVGRSAEKAVKNWKNGS